ncbi:flagellar hook protein FlgE [Geodermatophilus bullaregiensis]|uniref:flagellar hook protein FlgE n=1 Tax=Geodermatophilus bullaregiensis TaxID=1564160 RepID=UPI001956AB5F|nr:flagellar hook protein FlgE [Geodermatophilus bullaregiensis]MBM7807447.1 flagellar hook protein FlgE [Geodermatophilus bullaregiensis]
MLRSMFSAISGLRAHQTKLDVTGNNIANVNTVGYKSSQTVFEDTLSQVIRNGSAPTDQTGGTNPAQVGLGVKVAGITTNFGQGSTQNTGRSTDFMISGDGFFVTRSGNESLYTRAGSFDYDGLGNLVTPDGAQLQGWMAQDGVVSTNGAIGPLTIPFGQVMAPTRTREGTVVGNLSTASTAADPLATPPVAATAVQTQITAYDSLGTAHQIALTFTKAGANQWDVAASEGGVPIGGAQRMSFDPSTGLPLTGTAFTVPVAGANWPGGGIAVDLNGMTEFGGKTSLTPDDVDGNAMGTLQSISLSGDGTIMGVYSNSLREPIGKLALATFANPSGLSKAGNTSFRVGDNSGQPVIGEAGSGGRGSLTAGALEMSNVDLAEEFTGLIVAQRGFQANSRVITSSDEILQDLVNLKR